MYHSSSGGGDSENKQQEPPHRKDTKEKKKKKINDYPDRKGVSRTTEKKLRRCGPGRGKTNRPADEWRVVDPWNKKKEGVRPYSSQKAQIGRSPIDGAANTSKRKLTNKKRWRKIFPSSRRCSRAYAGKHPLNKKSPGSTSRISNAPGKSGLGRTGCGDFANGTEAGRSRIVKQFYWNLSAARGDSGGMRLWRKDGIGKVPQKGGVDAPTSQNQEKGVVPTIYRRKTPVQ